VFNLVDLFHFHSVTGPKLATVVLNNFYSSRESYEGWHRVFKTSENKHHVIHIIILNMRWANFCVCTKSIHRWWM